MSTPVSTRRPRSADPSRSGLPARPVVAVVIVVVLLVVVVGVLRVLGGGGGGGGGGDAPQRVAIPLGGRTAASVSIDSGADNVNVTAADLGSDLAVVTTPDGTKAGVGVDAKLTGNVLSVATKDDGDPADGSVVTLDVTVNKNVTWDVAVTKGARQIKLALAQGSNIGSVELNGGADNADVTLPKPRGIQNVRIPTGLANVAVHLAPGTHARVAFANGAGQSVIDGNKKIGLGAGSEVYAGGNKSYATVSDKVFIDVTAGVGNISVDHAAS